MGVLRRAYVEVLPDTDGFDGALTKQLKAADPGGKSGKLIGKQLGGQLNLALARLDLPAIDVKANPKAALAALEAVEAKLHAMSGDAATVEVKVQTEKALGQLARFRKQLGDVGDQGGEEAATGFAARFGARIGPLIGSVAASPPVITGGALIGAGLAPGILAGVAGAVVGAAGIGGVVGGVLLAARNEQVKQAGKDLGAFVLGDLEKRSSQFVPAVLAGIGRIRQGFVQIGPDLDRIFTSSRFVEPLVDGAVKGARAFIAGFADAVEQADPVIEALRQGLVQIGVATGDVFKLLASDAKEGASSIADLTFAVSSLITTTGGIIHAGAQVKGYTDELDKLIDRGRYWIEDNSYIAKSLRDVGIQVDLTADGFKVGSAEAEAYRKATTGAATAADFATLKTAGMSDAQIAAADASGRYRGELERVKTETVKAAGANGVLVASEDDVTVAQKTLTNAQQDYTRTLDTMGAASGRAAQLADGLRRATTSLYGAQIAATDANEAYQASWDDLSSAVKKNKGSLDVHTAAGRANRDALQNLLTKTNDLFFAEIATGTSIAGATKKHQARIEAVKEEARRVGLNREETRKLIATYGQIPKKKQTDLVVAGLNGVIKALRDLYVFQRSLADGIPIASEIAKLKGESGPAKKYGGYHTGGYTGPGGEHDPAGVVHSDEFVIRKSSRRQIERAHPGMLAEMNATGQVPGYAGGGFVAPVDTSRRWPFVTNAGHTKVPTKAQVTAKVIGAPGVFGQWPSSPSAQRGDSGVWRKVVALIKSTGPLSGSFGNAYRPGDPLWHGSGRAVDWMGYNQDALATFLSRRRPLELIHRTKQRDYAYTRGKNKGSFNNSLMEAHRNHVHIAMAGGGVINEPVVGQGLRSGNSYSFGERGPETVTPGVGGNTYNINISVPVGAHPAEVGRQTVTAIQAFERSNGSRWRE